MRSRHLFTLAAASVAVVVATATSWAEAQVRQVRPAAQPARQAPAPGVAAFGSPNPAGLASPVPGGLTPPTLPSLTPPGTPNLASPGAAPGSPVVDPGVATPYAAGGGGGYANTGAMGAGPRVAPLSSVDIARAFLDADINRDGELSRLEAQRLGLPIPFDDLDRNHDGMLSRFEYDDAFR